MTTTQPVKSRRHKLEEFLAAHPGDAFAQYGLAMECAREGDSDAAIRNFESLLAAHKDYVSGYFQYGQFLVRTGRVQEAKNALNSGIAAAKRTGDDHAQSEMSAALAELPA
jgi:predicted Zn-dependent protease